MSLQLAFGSFGDFATLIQIIRELAILIRDAATMRRDIRRFTTFLDEYSATMSCIEDILKPGPVHVLPHTVLQCIRNAVREASRLIRNFITYMYKFRSKSWWGEIVIKRLRWVLWRKALSPSVRWYELHWKWPICECSFMCYHVLSFRHPLTWIVYDSGTSIRVIHMMSTSLPNQPVVHHIIFIDFFNRRMNIPLDWFKNEKVIRDEHYLSSCILVLYIALIGVS